MNLVKKSCLVISYGPVPTPEHQTVEGGGMRAWGLAKGLQDNGIKATVAINAGFPLSLNVHEGIELISWNLDSEFIKTINSYDAVIVSYCAGDLSVFVADNINDDVQLILDAYVPIYIEVSARDAKDMDVEYVNYMADLQRHNHTLKRGDYFLYANPAQEQLYSGVLSALGIINPHSYREQRLIYAPFGIHRDKIKTTTNPYVNLGISKDDFVVLWFGGIYPWFRIEEYLDSIKSLSKDKEFKFVFVGGKNPFNANPDIARQYEKALEFSHNNKLFNRSVYFVDWVDFDTRINWFHHADVIISLNQPGSENKYSWRTRVMDFVWGEAATITNGGDPLSEEMIDNSAAIALESLSSATITDALRNLHSKPNTLKDIQKNVRKLKDKYYWDVVTDSLGDIIRDAKKPYSEELRLQRLLPDTLNIEQMSLAGGGRIRKIAKIPLKIVRKVRQKGVLNTAKIALDVASVQTKKRLSTSRRERQFIFISHPIDNTGAPIVLLQVIEEYAVRYGANRVRVIAPGIEKKQEDYLKSLGIKVEKAVYGASFHFIRLQLGLQPDDFVLMNTVAIYDCYRDFILLWLKIGRLNNAHWFIHEDVAQLPIINSGYLDKQNISRIQSLVESNKLDLLFPSKRTLLEYQELLAIDKGSVVRLRVEVPEKYRGVRKDKDFDTINILLSGTSSDGRKGQMLALSAMQEFINNSYTKDPTKYRMVKLHLLAIGKTDYISQQLRWIGNSVLKDHVRIYDVMPKSDALDITHKCNVVLCCSLNETFGLYIAEGMLMGHVVLRNNSAGVDEQLVDGKNGYLIDHQDINSISSAIEKLADKGRVSNSDLVNMGATSVATMDTYTKTRYYQQIGKIQE